MWIAELDTEHYRFRAAGTTQKQAREAIAAGFLRHLAGVDNVGEEAALRRFDSYVDRYDNGTIREPSTPETFADAVDEYYSIILWRLKPGEASRDFDEV